MTRDFGPETATGDNVISVSMVAKTLINIFFPFRKQAVSPRAVDPHCTTHNEVMTKVYFIDRESVEVWGYWLHLVCPLFDWRRIGWSYQASR